MWRKTVISTLSLSTALVGAGIMERHTTPQAFANSHVIPYLKQYLHKDPGKWSSTLLNQTGIFGKLLGSLKSLKEENCVAEALKKTAYYDFKVAKLFEVTVPKCGCPYGVEGQTLVMWSFLGKEWVYQDLKPEALPLDRYSLFEICVLEKHKAA